MKRSTLWRSLLLVLLAEASTISAAPLNNVKNVFVIVFENHNWSSIVGSPSAPYINKTLLPIASHAEAYYNPPGLHPSLPNYLWMEAGTNFGIADDNDPSIHSQGTTAHLVAQLASAGIGWKSYQEDIPGTNCPLVAIDTYTPRHNPMLYFQDVTNNNSVGSVYCIGHVRPFSELAADLHNETVPQYVFITPNVCNDGHDACAPLNDPIAQADTWLKTNLPMLLNSPAYKQAGAIFITWDEAENGDGPIGMIVLSPFAKGDGYANNIHYTHGSLLRTVQEIFGVSPLLRDAANQSDLSDLFQNATIVPTGNFFPYPGSTAGSLGVSSYGQVAVRAPVGTAWTAMSNASWLTVLSGASGSGNGVVHFGVAANPGGVPRTGTLIVGGQTFTVTQAGPPPPTTIVPVIEYHNTATDDYFITAFPAEQTFVDSGAVGPWVRTGKNFNSGGPIPVYRFGGNPIINPATGNAYGPFTHFYTLWVDEQSWLQTLYNPSALSWTIEEPSAPDFGLPMYMQQPNPDRTCPAGYQQVFRASSSGGFHRFTPFASALQEVLSRGWTNEGVAFCAPQ